jgi:peroxiredoxin
MTHPMVSALDEAVRQCRGKGSSLSERLQLIANLVRERAPPFADQVDRFVGRLEAVRAGSQAPQVGEIMPQFTLPDQDGRFVSLEDVLRKGPAVLVFHRGHWCPYCRLNIAGLADIEERAKPAQIIGISAETQQFTRRMQKDAGARFPILSDVGAGYALSLNLIVWVDEQMSRMIEGAGWDVPHYQGGTDWILPIPAVFVVRQDGVIAARHVDPDYRRRMELDELLRGVDLVREAPVRGD